MGFIWNNSPNTRNPLSSAISKDEGGTWENIKDIEYHIGYESAYPAVTFLENEALLTYYSRRSSTYRESVHLKIFDVDWFYD